MINYSIVMRSVNANLLAINQAKSRINQAKKEGKEPEKEDLDLVKTEKQNAFAVSQYTDIVTIEKFAKQFKTLRDDAEFNLVASRSAQAAVIKAIKEGKTSVDLDAPTTPEGGGDGTSGGGSTTGGGSNTGGSEGTGGENTGGTGSDGQGGESSGTEGGGGQMGL